MAVAFINLAFQKFALGSVKLVGIHHNYCLLNFCVHHTVLAINCFSPAEVFGKLLGLDNDLPDEILVGGFLNSADAGILPELNSTAQPQSQQQAHPAINSSTYGITCSQVSASSSNPTATSQLNMYNPHVSASDPRFAGLSNANSVPSPQPTAISTSADPTPTCLLYTSPSPRD